MKWVTQSIVRYFIEDLFLLKYVAVLISKDINVHQRRCENLKTLTPFIT